MTSILVDMPCGPDQRARMDALPGVRAVPVTDDPGSEVPREQPAALLRETDILFCMLPPKNFGEMTRLRLVQIGVEGAVENQSELALD